MVAFAKTNLLLAISAIPSSLSFARFPNYAKRNIFFFAFSSYLTRARILDAYKVCRKFLYQQYIQIQIYSQATRKQVLTIVSAFIAIEHCLRITLGDLIEVTHLLEDLACYLVFRVSLPYDFPTIVKIVQ